MKKVFLTFLQKVGIKNAETEAEANEVKEEHLAEATAKISSLEQELADTKNELQQKSDQITGLESDLKAAEDAVATEKARADKAEGELAKAKQTLAGKSTLPISKDTKSEISDEKPSFETSVDKEVQEILEKANK